MFHTKIVEIDIREKKKSLANEDHSLKVFTIFERLRSSPKRHHENNSLFSGTYPYRPNKGVPPPRPLKFSSFFVLRQEEN